MNWNKAELLAVLPQRLRKERYEDVTEVRLRLGQAPMLVTDRGRRNLEGNVTEEELRFVLNAASRYSPWNSGTLQEGYLTAPGGHRIGVCGDGTETGFREISSLCIRVARDVHGIASGLPESGSLLILGAPGCGKTTLLRDYVRMLSRDRAVGVVDERREVFPEGFLRGNADVLSGVCKARGIDMVLRAMGPQVIAMDEVTSQADCEALVRAMWCGVELIATAHAASVSELKSRVVYRPLVEAGVFARAVVLGWDRQWHIEEVGGC